MAGLLQDFINIVSEGSSFQKAYLEEWSKNAYYKKELELLLEFYLNQCGYDLAFLAEAYNFINEMVMEETYYFIQNGTYRHSTFAEVNDRVYQNKEYMTKYMCGLTISDHIWHQHIEMLSYFEAFLGNASGDRYLEIGPGFGQYLLRAIEKDGFKRYLAVDLSEASVQGCKNFIKYRNKARKETVQIALEENMEGKYAVLQKNFFEFDAKEKFDCIVMGEVLEHVEEPLQMLEKISSLLTKDGTAFLTTVINAPAIDHIYLFSTIDEVLEMVKDAGLQVKDYICAVAGNMPLEQALRKKRAITIAMIAEKL